MRQVSKSFGWHAEDIRSAPLDRYGQQITPIGQVIRMRWPLGMVVWQRPLAVEVHTSRGIERMPIQNITRRLIAAVMLAELGTALVLWRVLRAR